ncbi:MAG: hypothetical protein K0S15_2441, partial [Solirubrobacterales bacterium]|nr:hypothetical protein [Solirubrobacterales bacterium]
PDQIQALTRTCLLVISGDVLLGHHLAYLAEVAPPSMPSPGLK